MFKKIRKYWWLLQNLVKKYYIYVGIGITINLILWVFAYNLFINNKILSKTQKIGIAENYTSDNIPQEVTRLISRGLTKINPKGQYETDLAEKITIKNDGKIYHIKLKNNLKWTNGKKFTAKDINYQFQNVTFVVKNDYEGYFILKEKFAPFIGLLSIPITDENLNGLGEYKVDSIEFDGKFIKKIALFGPKKIIYKFYPNQKAAQIAFTLGEINVLNNVQNIDEIKLWKNVKITKNVNTNRFVAIFFSFKSNFPGVEKTFRQALAYSINKKAFTEKSAFSSYSPKSPFYEENVKKYFYDEKSANSLFSKIQKDKSKAKKIAFTLYTNKEYEKYATQIANNWNKVLGTNIKVKTTEGLPYQWQTYLTISEIPEDPDQYALWHSNKTFRFSNYINLKVDKLLEDGRTEIDQEKRKTIYQELQKSLAEDLPAIFLFYPNSYTLSY